MLFKTRKTFGTQIKIFLMKSGRFLSDINTTDTFKAQKGSKDVVKMVHVTSVVQLFLWS